MIKKEEVVRIGKFTKPHGVKGEIGLAADYVIFEEPDDNSCLICELEGILVPFFIESCRYKTQTLQLVKFAQVDTEDEVRELAGKEAYLPLSAIGDETSPTPTSWEAFRGYELVAEKQGTLGELKAIDDSTINVLLQIDYRGRELLIPAVEQWIISVDHRKKQLTVSIPDGLLEM